MKKQAIKRASDDRKNETSHSLQAKNSRKRALFAIPIEIDHADPLSDVPFEYRQDIPDETGPRSYP